MLYFEKARELANLLLETEEGKRVLESREAFFANEQSVEKLSDFNKYQTDIQQKVKDGILSEEEIQLAMNKSGDLFEELNADPIIGNMINAEKELNNIITQVVNIFYSTLSGREANTDCSSCSSGGCSGCK